MCRYVRYIFCETTSCLLSILAQYSRIGENVRGYDLRFVTGHHAP